MILGSLLSEIPSSAEIGAAFRALDAVRRPRVQRIIDSSRETGQIMCGQNIDVGLNKDKTSKLWRRNGRSFLTWIWHGTRKMQPGRCGRIRIGR